MLHYRVLFLLGIGLSVLSLSLPAKEINIAMLLWRGQTITEHAFKQELAALGYQAHYTVYDADFDRRQMTNHVRQQLLPNIEQFDYVYSFGTTVSQIAKHYLKERKPQIFNIVLAPVETSLVKSLEAPNANISGASVAVSPSKQLTNVRQFIPFKRLGLLFNPRERNSIIMRSQILEIAALYDFSIVDLSVPAGMEQFYDYVEALKRKEIVVDAMYFLADSFVTHNAAEITRALHELGIKTIGSAAPQVKRGALIGTVADYRKLGRYAAHIIDRHQNGEMLHKIPVQQDAEPYLLVNRTAATELDFVIPELPETQINFVE